MTPAEALAKALFDASGEPMTNWMMGAANREKHSRHADRILAALAAAGFVVVPEVATIDMLIEGERAKDLDYHSIGRSAAGDCYAAMIAARPR